VIAPADLSDAAFTALTVKIAADRGFGCASYKDKCLRRRIAVRMRARGVHSYAEYARVLDADQAEYDRLLDALTINVTKLFRNWETYTVLRERIVPALTALPDPVINVWSAGCSSGEEPYSLAALFHEHAERNGASAIAEGGRPHRRSCSATASPRRRLPSSRSGGSSRRTSTTIRSRGPRSRAPTSAWR